MGLQGVIRGFEGLQGVTGDHNGLHKDFFRTRTSPDTFLDPFPIKIKVDEISKF